MAVTHDLVIGYFDTRKKAADNELRGYDEIFTSGYALKNDGGGGHYKRYDPDATAPPLGFEASESNLNKTHWTLIPDGGVINPLQAGAKADGSNDRDALQECIDFIKYWNTTDHQVTYTTVHGKTITDADSSRNAVKLVIPANRRFTVDRTGTNAPELDLTGPLTIEDEDRFSSVIRLRESTTGSNSGPVENDPINGSFGVDNSLSYSTNGGITGIRFRNFTMRGSYGNPSEDATDKLTNGDASLFTFHDFKDELF